MSIDLRVLFPAIDAGGHTRSWVAYAAFPVAALALFRKGGIRDRGFASLPLLLALTSSRRESQTFRSLPQATSGLRANRGVCSPSPPPPLGVPARKIRCGALFPAAHRLDTSPSHKAGGDALKQRPPSTLRSIVAHHPCFAHLQRTARRSCRFQPGLALNADEECLTLYRTLLAGPGTHAALTARARRSDDPLYSAYPSAVYEDDAERRPGP